MLLPDSEIDNLQREIDNLYHSNQLEVEGADIASRIVGSLSKLDLSDSNVTHIIEELRTLKPDYGDSISVIIKKVRSVCGSYL